MDINDDDKDFSRDAGDKKLTKGFIRTKALLPELFDYDEGALVPIKTIIENIENLNNIRKSISEKTGLILKMLEKYENTSSDNEYVNNVLKSVSAYKKPILDFMKLDMTLERCLNTQFEIFTKYSKKHSKTKGTQQSPSDEELFNKYVAKDGEVQRSEIALDVADLTLSRHDIIRLCSMSEVKKVFIGISYSKKEPQEKWNKEYLDKLVYASSVESFNKDYLLYLNDVAVYVMNGKKKKR